MKVFSQLESAQAESLASNPSNAPWGRIFFDTALAVLKFWNKTAWATVPGQVVAGTYAAGTSVTSSGIATLPGGAADHLIFVAGSGGPVIVAANPALPTGAFVGQKIKLKGTSDTNTVRFNNGNGLSQQGDIILANGDTIQYCWDGSVWSEDFRR